MSDVIRPQVSETFNDLDLNEAVEEFSDQEGMTKKDAWARLVFQGLICPQGAEVTVVVDERRVPIAVRSTKQRARSLANKLVDEESSAKAGLMTLSVDAPVQVDWLEEEEPPA